MNSDVAARALYKTIDGKIKKRLQGSGVATSQTKAFLAELLPKSDVKDVDTELKKYYSLETIHKIKGAGNESKGRKKKTRLTLQERRQLGLYKIPRNGLKFESYISLNRLWKDYMRNYLDISEFKNNRTGTDQPSLQLQKADYHGAMVTVTRSRCASLVGTSGILLMDTKNTFKLICKDNKVRIIPKENSVFNVTLDDIMFTMFGKHIQVKSAERSTKKFKARLICDL